MVFSFSGRSGDASIACRRRIRTGLLTGSRHHPRVNIFHFPRRLHVLQTFCAAKCRPGFASFAAAGSFGLNFASSPVVHLPFRNKSASAKGKVAVSGGGVRRLWRPKTSNWRSESLERGGIFAFPLRAPSGTRYGGEGKLRVGLVAVAWREGNKNRCLILQSLAAALAA